MIIHEHMWPLYLLFSKSLKTEDEVEGKRANIYASNGDPLHYIELYPHEQLSRDRRWLKSGLPLAHFTEVPHINQLSSWDCGLACILMVLRTIGINTCDIEKLSNLCCTTSIWTVDLAYLLKRFSVKFSFYTITFGANPGYCDERYYKDQLPTDLLRVDKLFQDAPMAGIEIECRSISEEQISLLILSGRWIAIALVDQYKLNQAGLDEDSLPDFCSSCTEYTGHYIVICGYDSDKDEFEIRDPASSRKYERISSKWLGEARKSFGTDEDLLLISLEKR